MEFLWPIAIAIVGIVLLVLWQLDRKRVLAEMDATPGIAVVIYERNIRTTRNTESGNEHHAYWLTVIRQDTSEQTTLEVTKGEYFEHSEGQAFELNVYPGTGRLVYGKKLGGPVDRLRNFGIGVLVVAVLVAAVLLFLALVAGG